MSDLAQYWREIRDIQSQLPDYVWLMSLENAVTRLVGGCLVEAAAELAAKLLHARSHRLATEAEVAALKVKEEQAKQDAAIRERERRGVAIVPLK